MGGMRIPIQPNIRSAKRARIYSHGHTMFTMISPTPFLPSPTHHPPCILPTQIDHPHPVVGTIPVHHHPQQGGPLPVQPQPQRHPHSRIRIDQHKHPCHCWTAPFNSKRVCDIVCVCVCVCVCFVQCVLCYTHYMLHMLFMCFAFHTSTLVYHLHCHSPCTRHL